MNAACCLLFFMVLMSCTSDESASNHSAFSTPLDTSTKTAEEVATLWNEAINARNWAVLDQLYADKVRYYAKKRSKDHCVQHKMDKIGPNNDFSQQITDFQTNRTYFNTYEVFFDKTFGTSKDNNTVRAFLSLVKTDAGWQITQESDVPTRNNRCRLCSCSDFWVAWYNGGHADYYHLSRDGIYGGEDGMYVLMVDYNLEEEGTISFTMREMSQESTSGFLGREIFDLKKETLKSDVGGPAEPYNQPFLKKLHQYCQ